jgi:hypothetical protein
MTVRPPGPEYLGLCIGGPLDGKRLKSSSPFYREIIRRPVSMTIGPVAAMATMPDYVEYRHLYQPWRGPSGQYRDFWIWLAAGVCEAEARETLQQRFPDGPPGRPGPEG